jgi:hypothetical protein
MADTHLQIAFGARENAIRIPAGDVFFVGQIT